MTTPSKSPEASGARSMLTVAEAQNLILNQLTPVSGWESVSVRDALNRIIAQDIIAPFNVPAHDNSAMDGYAVRHADVSAKGEHALKVVGTAFAGKPFSGMVRAGQAIRIMTGATIPQGIDAIVPQEETRSEADQVFIQGGVRQGQHIRRAGEDLALGGVAIASGRRCGPAELGLIASLGIADVVVHRRLRVAFFSTGDEIASIGRPLAPGQIYDSNRYTLHAALRNLDCEPIDMGVIPDNPESLEKAFRDAIDAADVILTSGGVSVGEADFIRELVNRLGQVEFWKLAIKPGRPMAFGRMDNTWLFGLPGNPVAVMVTFYQIVRDALLKLSGLDPLPEAQLIPAMCSDEIRKRPGRKEFLRGHLINGAGGRQVSLAGAQGSGILKSMSEANCFIVLDEADGNIEPGQQVMVQPFAGLIY